MPVIVLWAGALTLLGAAGLLAVPQVADAASTDHRTTPATTRRNQMKQHLSIARRCAAVVTATALTLGASSLLAPALTPSPKPKPQKGSVTGDGRAGVRLLPAFGAEFDYDAKIKLNGDPRQEGRRQGRAQGDVLATCPASRRSRSTTTPSATLVADGRRQEDRRSRARDTSPRPRSAPVPMPPVKGIGEQQEELAGRHGHEVGPGRSRASAMNCVPAESGALGTLKLK